MYEFVQTYPNLSYQSIGRDLEDDALSPAPDPEYEPMTALESHSYLSMAKITLDNLNHKQQVTAHAMLEKYTTMRQDQLSIVKHFQNSI